ncbi:MAG: glycosyltransferase family 2 protein [Planctomycetota bacterium]
MSEQAPVISIIIVSFNTRDVTLACIRSIYDHAGSVPVEVIVVDNASEDGSADAIAKEFPQTTLIADTENRGFAGANNRGLEIARGEWLLLLNPDTEINAETLDATRAHAETDPEIGIIGVRCFGDDGEQQSTIFRYPKLLDTIVNVLVPNKLMRKSKMLGRSRYIGVSREESLDVEIVAGCYMFTRREAYEQAGGMDDRFFMYGEEAEWCFRVHRHGWKIRYFPGASILHYGGISTEKCMSEMNLAMARSHLLLMQRVRGRAAAWIANFCMLLRDLPRALAWPFIKLSPIGRNEVVAEGMRRASGRLRVHFLGLTKTDWSR